MKKQLKSCPSSVAVKGALLLGVVNEEGRVGYISSKIDVTEELMAQINEMPHPEKHFRFSSNCVECGCRQWQNGNCSVIKNIVSSPGSPKDNHLPDCSIRSTCRWYSQEGSEACYHCAFVVTDNL
jgi:hypothetical protein